MGRIDEAPGYSAHKRVKGKINKIKRPAGKKASEPLILGMDFKWVFILTKS